MASSTNFQEVLRFYSVDMLMTLDVTKPFVDVFSRRVELSRRKEEAFLMAPMHGRAIRFLGYLIDGDAVRFNGFIESLIAVGESHLAARWNNPVFDAAEAERITDSLKLKEITAYQRDLLLRKRDDLKRRLLRVDPVLDALKSEFVPWVYSALKADPGKIDKFIEHVLFSSQSFYIATILALLFTTHSRVAARYFAQPRSRAEWEAASWRHSSRCSIPLSLRYYIPVALDRGCVVSTLSSDQSIRTDELSASKSAGAASEPGVRVCSVCLDAKPNAVFIECGHIACCEACARALLSRNKCPVCRSESRWIKCFEV